MYSSKRRSTAVRVKGFTLAAVFIFSFFPFSFGTENGSLIQYNTTHAQTVGPGGHAGNYDAWYVSGLGGTLSGGMMSSLPDQSGKGNTISQATAANRPAYVPLGLNFNGTMTFDGNDRLTRTGNATFTTGTGARTVFFVANAFRGVFFLGGNPVTDRQNLLWTSHGDTGGTGVTLSGANSSNAAFSIRKDSSTINKYIIAQTKNAAGANLSDFTFGINGGPLGLSNFLQAGTVSNFAPNIQGNNIVLGGKYTTQSNVINEMLSGSFAEVILLNGAVDATATNKIQSYLALKYGIQLDQSTPQNYTASDGTLMWSHTKAGAYNREIFGLGRDTASNWQQRVSKATDSTDILTLSLDTDFTAANTSSRSASNTNNLQFLTIANNGGAVATTQSEMPTAATTRLAREWQLQKTNNFTQDAYLRFTGYNASWRLVADDDGNFSSGTTNLGPLNGSGVKLISALEDGSYFTLMQIGADLTLSGNSVDVDENGGTNTFTVALSSQPDPGTQVILSVVSGNTSEATVSPAPLTFTYENWDTPQTVTVTGVDDNMVQSTQTTVTVSTAGGTTDSRFQSLSKAVAVRIIEDDVAEMLIGVNGQGDIEDIVIYEDVGTGEVDVSLAAQPTANVVINFVIGDAGEASVSPTQLTFTPLNYNTPQRVTVTAVDDNIVRDDATTLTVEVDKPNSANEYSEADSHVIAITIIDNDIPGFTVSHTTFSLNEDGGTNTFTVVLDTEPLTNVVLTVSSSDTNEATVSPTSLTFTPANWNTPQTVTVTGVDDDIPNIDHSATITVSVNTGSSDATYHGIGSKTVLAVLLNDDNNVPPTDILLDGQSTISIDETTTSGSSVASISAVDEDFGDTHTFTLDCGTPGVDDASFTISGSNLNTATALEYSTKNTYNICIKAVDSVGGEIEKNFTITINEIDSTPPDEATVSSPASGALVNSPTTFSGTCEIGAIVRFAHNDIEGGIAEATCTDDGSGNGVYTVEVQWSESAASGEKTITITQEDASGNVSDPTSAVVDLDVDVPAAPGATGPTEGSLVQNPTTVSGTCEPGATIRIANDDIIPNPTEVLCDGDGTYEVDVVWDNNVDGNQTLVITQIDPAGNESPATELDVVLDATPPLTPVVDSANAQTIAGTCEAGATVRIAHSDLNPNPHEVVCDNDGEYEAALTWSGSVNDGPKTLSIMQIDDAGNESSATTANVTVDTTAPDAPSVGESEVSGNESGTISGTCEVGATVTLTHADVEGSPLTITCADGTYEFEFDWIDGVTDGTKQVLITQTDPDGNESPATQVNLLIDTVAPNAPVASVPVEGAEMSNPTTISGTCEPGATISIANPDIDPNPTTTICGSGGHYSVDIVWDESAADGDKTLVITQTDPSGNESSSTSVEVTLDTVAPIAPTVSTPTNGNPVTGTGEPGATVEVTTTSGSSCTTTVQGDGTWSCTLSPSPKNGDTITIKQTDPAGNESSATTVPGGVTVATSGGSRGSSGTRRPGGGGATTTPSSMAVPHAASENARACSLALYPVKPIMVGGNNDVSQVMLLETYLNEFENANLPVDGEYGEADIRAVIAWQEKYASEILAPWGITQGTGHIYTTSLAKFRSLFQGQCVAAAPITVSSSVRDLTMGYSGEDVRALQNLLIAQGYPIPAGATGFFALQTRAALVRYQAAHGVSPAVGFFGSVTRAAMKAAGHAGLWW